MRCVNGRLLLFAMLLFLASQDAISQNAAGYLVYHGQPKAVIVAPGGPTYQFAAHELQRYLYALSGAQLQIVDPGDAGRAAGGMNWILLGGPDGNGLVKDAETKKLVAFEGLKAGGYILRDIELDGHSSLVAGGPDDASTMYAAYDLVERLGADFLITGDVLPAKRSDLQFSHMDFRSEPAFARRGIYTTFEYENRSIMSLKDWHNWLDQMAKLKFNYLHLQWYPYEPWIRYEYSGETKWMGDVSKAQTGYMLRSNGFGQQWTSKMEVGLNKFKAAGIYPGLAPPEFQNLKDPGQAFQVAQTFLRDIVDYAKSRKIEVWLGIDATSVAPNLAKYTTTTTNLPYDPIFGTFICPDNPVSLELNEARLKSLFQTYPAADGFFMWLPEGYPVCNHNPAERKFYLDLRSQYLGEAESHTLFTSDIAREDDQIVDSNSGSVYFIKKLFEARDRIAPDKKLGVAAYGRLYLWPFIDKMFEKSVPFDEMESAGVWTPAGVPMELFSGMRARPNTIINRIDDDGNMLGMQFNIGLYDKDQVLISADKYGVTGFASQAYRDPETDWNIKYMSEGGYNAHLTPEQFYHDYSTGVFGKDAAPQMERAFATLEKNEQFMNWNGRANFGCCGPPRELQIAYEYWKQPDIYSGPTIAQWRTFISWAYDQTMYYRQSVQLLESALEQLEGAQANVAPQARERLAYLINRTQAYIIHLQTLIAWEQAYIDLDNTFANKPHGMSKEFVSGLDASLAAFQAAHEKALATANKWNERIDYPASDLGVLYRINTYMVTGTELALEVMQNLDNYYHGRDYLKPVDFGKVFTLEPVLRQAVYPDV
jgi:hypothetical protein